MTTWNAGDVGDAPQAIFAPVVDDAAAGPSVDDKYTSAYKYAGNLVRKTNVSERRAAELASKKFAVPVSRYAAKAASSMSLRPGQDPPPIGRHQIVSKDAEDYLLGIVK